MREPIVDVILLSLLILFFGFEQRRRPELYFRFWLAGWLLILLSVVSWEIRTGSAVQLIVLNWIRWNSLACGALAFVFSFVASKQQWRIMLMHGVAIAVPVCLTMDLIAAHTGSRTLLYGLILLGECLALRTAYRFLSRKEPWFFAWLAATCVACGALMLSACRHGHAADVTSFILAQAFLGSALLLGRSGFKGGRLAGCIGFMVWAGFYLVTTNTFGSEPMLSIVHDLWPIPKYLVGVGMILTIFGEVAAEIADLSLTNRRLYEEYRVLFISNPHPMWIYEAHTTRFLAVNDAAVMAYGFSLEEFLGMSVADLEIEEPVTNLTELRRQVTNRTRRHRRADGSVLDVDVTDREMMFEGHSARFMLAVDITEKERLHRDLVHQAQHDVLTGLPNRSTLDERISKCLARCLRDDKKAALLTIDIDHFKRVNDTYGHLVGDECLKVTAARLSSRVRQVDTIARTGGEEFTIVVGGVGNRNAAEKVCAEMLKLFATPVRVGEHELQVTISIGVALFPDHAVDIEGLRRQSDQALYEAKRLGRNQAAFAMELAVPS